MTASNPCCEKCECDGFLKWKGNARKQRLADGCICTCHKETTAAVDIVQDAKTGAVLEANGVKFSYEKTPPQPEKEWWEEFIEAGAALEHERWAKWERYIYGLCTKNPDGSLTIPATQVEKSLRQQATAYADLTESEKEADRREVRSYLPLLESLKARIAAQSEKKGRDAVRDTIVEYLEAHIELEHERENHKVASSLFAVQCWIEGAARSSEEGKKV